MRYSLVIVHLFAFAAYALLSVLLAWPMVTGLTTYVYNGDGGAFAYSGLNDVVHNVWYLWWTRTAMSSGQNPFYTDLLYFPDGVQLYFQTLNLPMALLTLPVQFSFGVTAAYNVSVMLALLLVGYASFLLVRTTGAGPLAAWLVGALVAACPFLAMKLQVSHLNLLNIQWLIFYLVALLYLERGRTLWAVVPTALLVPVVVLGDWHYGLVAVVCTVVWGGLGVIKGPRRGALLGRYLLLGGLSVVFMTPLLLGLWQVREQLGAFTASQRETWDWSVRGYSADALGLFFPSLLQPHWRQQAEALTAPLVRSISVVEGWYIAAGWTLMLLAGIGVWRYGRSHWRLLVVAGVTWVFSLGPELRFAGVWTGVPMPYALLEGIPLVSSARRPNLFAVVCIVIAAYFAGAGLQWLLDYNRRGTRLLVLTGLVALATFELWPTPRERATVAPPELFVNLGTQSGPILDLPVDLDINARTLQNQLGHGQPVLRGYVPRPPDAPILSYAPLIRAVAMLEPLPEREIVPLDADALAAMQCRYGFQYLVIDHILMTEAQRQQVLTDLGRLPAFEPIVKLRDDRHTAYELPLHRDRCAPFAYLGGGWTRLEQDGDRHWRWIGEQAELWIVNPSEQSISVVVEWQAWALNNDDAVGPDMLRVRHTADEVPIVVIPIARIEQVYRFVLPVAPGEQRFLLEPERTYREPGGRSVSISIREITVR